MGKKKEKLLQLFEKGIVVVKRTEETKVAKKQPVVKQAIPVKKEEVVIKKKTGICTIYYSKSNSDVRTKRCGTIFHSCIC